MIPTVDYRLVDGKHRIRLRAGATDVHIVGEAFGTARVKAWQKAREAFQLPTAKRMIREINDLDKIEPAGDDEPETHVLDDARDVVYDRPEQHGAPEDSFGRIADMWAAYLGVDVGPEDVANMMAALKIARNAEGVYHEDNYVDMAGYAENGARLHAESES